jgi:hypothetical protein
VNRAQRRRAAKTPGLQPITRAVTKAEEQRVRLEAELWEQAREIRLTSPTANETPLEALNSVLAAITDLEQPQYQFVAGKALEELRGLRDDLTARIGGV